VKTRIHFVVAIGLVVSLFAASLGVAAQGTDNDNDFDLGQDHDFALPEFYDVWERTDYPVQQLEVARTWIWGPEPITPGLSEPYIEAEDGERLVQYFDKSRMEAPLNGVDPDSPWFITQGLLAQELMTGQLQLGHEEFENYAPAEIPVAGDWEDQTGPTYADMAQYIEWEPREEGAVITQTMDRGGAIDDDADLAEYGVTDEVYIEQTDHNIASVFWAFMESEGLIYVDGDYDEGPIFADEFYAIGYPLTEAYWGWVQVDGVEQNVLIQCFERRCLTFTPDNPEGWEVESGNIGLHYYIWRYHLIDEPITESGITIDPAEATNPFFGEHGIEVFEEQIAAWTVVDYEIEHGEGSWGDLSESEQQDILDAEFEEFWTIAVGYPAPNHHTVEITVTENGETVTEGHVDVQIVVDDAENGDVIVEDEVAIDNGVATVTYDASDFGDPTATTTNTITVTYGEITATATKTWVPFLEYEYDQNPTYLFLEHRENWATGEDIGATGPIGHWHDTIATLLDQFGQPVEGENLVFSITGPNAELVEWTSYNPNDDLFDQNPVPWDGVTNSEGQRAFSYYGTNPGDDVMRVEVEADAEIYAELTKVWAADGVILEPAVAVNPYFIWSDSALDVVVTFVDEHFEDLDTHEVEAFMASYVSDDGEFDLAAALHAATLEEDGLSDEDLETIFASIHANFGELTSFSFIEWPEKLIPLIAATIHDLDLELGTQSEIEAWLQASVEDGHVHVAGLVMQAVDDDAISAEDGESVFLALAQLIGLHEHTVTAKLVEDGELTTTGEVTFEISGSNDDGATVNIEDGAAVYTYWATAYGIDAANAAANDGAITGQGTKVWERVFINIPEPELS
jgi:hypothetical protein